ncbi:BadF-type ATPase [Pelagibacterium luteolum]|uniref:BadF-type ATPase n=1 Tax=Pelagibacterium luteolum TaxID=440168 RepID=A0A1G7S0K8_9HYPH|nr:BadF-type ATPase [Pelagibacterium luteolum]
MGDDGLSASDTQDGVCLGIDMGGTGSRWVLIDAEGAVLARGAAHGATGHLFRPEAKQDFIAVIAAIAAVARDSAQPRAVHIGATGLGEDYHETARDIVSQAFGLSVDSVSVGDDMDLAFRSVFAPGAGHLISVGTGSVGMHIGQDGEVVRVGGRGILIDDGGSGAWIALRALDGLYRILDEKGGCGDATILARQLFDAIGGDSWNDVRAYIYGADRGTIGSLARVVGAAAEAGDRLAQTIIAEAAGELARLGLALIKRAGERPVGFVGGLLDITPSFRSAIGASLSGHEVVFPQIDAALGAARIAQTLRR